MSIDLPLANIRTRYWWSIFSKDHREEYSKTWSQLQNSINTIVLWGTLQNQHLSIHFLFHVLVSYEHQQFSINNFRSCVKPIDFCKDTMVSTRHLCLSSMKTLSVVLYYQYQIPCNSSVESYRLNLDLIHFPSPWVSRFGRFTSFRIIIYSKKK